MKSKWVLILLWTDWLQNVLENEQVLTNYEPNSPMNYFFQSVPHLWSLTLLCLPYTWSSIKSLKTSSVSQGEFQGIISTRHDQLLSVVLSPRLPRRKEWYVAPRKHMPSVMVCMHRYINNFPTTAFCPTLIKLISQDVGLA